MLEEMKKITQLNNKLGESLAKNDEAKFDALMLQVDRLDWEIERDVKLRAELSKRATDLCAELWGHEFENGYCIHCTEFDVREPDDYIPVV